MSRDRWEAMPSSRQAQLRERYWYLTEEELAAQVATFPASGRCLAVRTGPVPSRLAAAGDDGRWHLTVGGHTVAPYRATRRRSAVHVDHGAARAAHLIPPDERAQPDLDWPPHIPAPVEFPETWPTNTPPKEYVWAVLYPLQNGQCGYCCQRAPHVVDHDHDSHLVRGLLCLTCNLWETRCLHDLDCFASYRAAPPAASFHWRHWRWRRAGERRKARDLQATRAALGLPSLGTTVRSRDASR